MLVQKTVFCRRIWSKNLQKKLNCHPKKMCWVVFFIWKFNVLVFESILWDISAHWFSQSFFHYELLICHELKPCSRPYWVPTLGGPKPCSCPALGPPHITLLPPSTSHFLRILQQHEAPGPPPPVGCPPPLLLHDSSSQGRQVVYFFIFRESI